MPSATKTDLIIGMTLAETFLLILLVVWYSLGTGAGPDWERIANDRQVEIDNLKAALQEQKEKLTELESKLDWWRKNFGTDPPGSIEQLQAVLRPHGLTVTKLDNKSGRSNLTPTCSELGLKEVLFSTVILGRDSFQVDATPKKFQELLSAYESDLRVAQMRDCRYLINVSYDEHVATNDYVIALRQLRSRFYTQLR
jgi:hypothetical protein